MISIIPKVIKEIEYGGERSYQNLDAWKADGS
jgi:hypothetical protein